MIEAPAVRVMRQSFFRTPGGPCATWTEHHPAMPRDRDWPWRGPFDASERPAGDPTDVRQEVRLLWPGCSIALEEGMAEPWVTFRRSGDADAWHLRRTSGMAEGTPCGVPADHAYFIFDARHRRAKVEIASPALGVPGVLVTNVVARSSRGDDGPGGPGDDQIWVDGSPWVESARRMEGPEEVFALARAMRLAEELRARVAPRVRDVAAPMSTILRAMEQDAAALEVGDLLRRMLEPFALRAEQTELHERVSQMYAQEVARMHRTSATIARDPRPRRRS